jgi:hypothetical protein
VAQLKWCINFVGWVEVMRPNIYLYICWVTLTLYPTYAQCNILVLPRQ